MTHSRTTGYWMTRCYPCRCLNVSSMQIRFELAAIARDSSLISWNFAITAVMLIVLHNPTASHAPLAILWMSGMHQIRQNIAAKPTSFTCYDKFEVANYSSFLRLCDVCQHGLHVQARCTDLELYCDCQSIDERKFNRSGTARCICEQECIRSSGPHHNSDGLRCARWVWVSMVTV